MCAITKINDHGGLKVPLITDYLINNKKEDQEVLKNKQYILPLLCN